ncbi:hypothetical protein VPH35_061910 [Triticum aestivum]
MVRLGCSLLAAALAVLRATEARLAVRSQFGQAFPCLQLCDVGSMPSGLVGLLPTVKTMTWRFLDSRAAASGVVVAASARGWCVSGRGGSWDPVARVGSASEGWWLVAAVGGGRCSAHLRKKSLLRSSLESATAMPAGAVIFLESVVVEVLLLHMALAPEGNLRSAGSGDGGVYASFSSLGVSPRSRLQLRGWWMMASLPSMMASLLSMMASLSSMAASSPRGLLRQGAGFCLATMMVSRGAWVVAWSSVVGSSRRV